MQFIHTHLVILLASVIVSLSCMAAEKRAPVSEPADTQIEQRVENLERFLQNQGLVGMLQQLQALQSEVSQLRGQIEVNSHELEKLQERQRNLYDDLERRMQKLNGTVASTTPPTDEEAPPLETITPSEPVAPIAGNQAETSLTVENTGPNPASTEQPAEVAIAELPTSTQVIESPAPEDPLKAQAEYQQAFNLLKQAQYDQAITAFDNFLRKYPASQYSANAQYWMGEAHYVARRFNEAITEYMKLVTNYPESKQVSNGLLKIGYSFYELGKPDDAKNVLEDLIKRYPGTPAARDAEDRLKRTTVAR